MKKNVLSEEEQIKRISEIMGRLDNNDFDTVYRHRRGHNYVGDEEIGIERPEIDFEDRDVEPDFYSADELEDDYTEFNDEYMDELDFDDELDLGDEDYVADFNIDMQIQPNRDYDNVDDEVEYGGEESVDSLDNENKYKI